MASPTRSLDLGKILGILETAPNAVTIVINGGRPSPKEALAYRGARVQFVNNDNQAYRVQVTNIVTLDYYLPPFDTLTVFVNNAATVGSEIDYLLSIAATPPQYPLHLVNALNSQMVVAPFEDSKVFGSVSDLAKSTFPVSAEELSAGVEEAKAAAEQAVKTLSATLGPGGKIIVKG